MNEQKKMCQTLKRALTTATTDLTKGFTTYAKARAAPETKDAKSRGKSNEAAAQESAQQTPLTPMKPQADADTVWASKALLSLLSGSASAVCFRPQADFDVAAQKSQVNLMKPFVVNGIQEPVCVRGSRTQM